MAFGLAYLMLARVASWLALLARADAAKNVEGSFMALGDGTHKLPVRTDVRRMIGKHVGDTVTVHLLERLA